jgi:hypothetical protein
MVSTMASYYMGLANLNCIYLFSGSASSSLDMGIILII